jgi:hypothetical protein
VVVVSLENSVLFSFILCRPLSTACLRTAFFQLLLLGTRQGAVLPVPRSCQTHYRPQNHHTRHVHQTPTIHTTLFLFLKSTAAVNSTARRQNKPTHSTTRRTKNFSTFVILSEVRRQSNAVERPRVTFFLQGGRNFAHHDSRGHVFEQSNARGFTTLRNGNFPRP